MARRCNLCARKLNAEGVCVNEKCPACKKAKIDKVAEESKEETK